MKVLKGFVFASPCLVRLPVGVLHCLSHWHRSHLAFLL